ESSEIPKNPRTDREKSPTGPFVLVTPFDVDRRRSLIKSVSFTPANREKSSTNRENSLVRTAHTETSVLTTLAPSVTPISYERTLRMPTSILSPMQIDFNKEIDYYNNNDNDDDDNEEHNDNRDKSDNCDKSDNREPLPKPHIVESERYLMVKEFNYAMNALDGKIKTKCKSRRNDFAASIRSAMFFVFREQRLERIDNNSSSMKIAEWKQNQKTCNAFYELFKNHDILTKIGQTQAFRNKTQITPRIMEELAEREVKEISQRTD
ncbi:hypothetical protein RhiirA4_473627, partial [Rhizophagus irregularis]